MWVYVMLAPGYQGRNLVRPVSQTMDEWVWCVKPASLLWCVIVTVVLKPGRCSPSHLWVSRIVWDWGVGELRSWGGGLLTTSYRTQRERPSVLCHDCWGTTPSALFFLSPTLWLSWVSFALLLYCFGLPEPTQSTLPTICKLLIAIRLSDYLQHLCL